MVGWFSGSDGTRAIPLTGTRVVDSRDGTGGWIGPIGPGEVRSFDPTVQGTVPVGAAALLDVVATNAATSDGWMTLYPCGGPVPPTSSVNPVPGIDSANVAVSRWARAGSSAPTAPIQVDLVIDVNASFGASGALQGLSVGSSAMLPASHPTATTTASAARPARNVWNVDAVGVPGSTVAVVRRRTVRHRHGLRERPGDGHGHPGRRPAEQYYLRCLPSDFPDLAVSRPDDPTPGWYLTTTGLQAPAGTTYAMVLDDHGAPVWYHKTPDRPRHEAHAQRGLRLVAAARLHLRRGPHRRVGGALDRRLPGPHLGDRRDPHRPARPVPAAERERAADLLPRAHGRRPDGLLGAGYGPGEDVVDGWIQEIRPNGTVAWEWHSEDHLGVAETTAQLDGVPLAADIPAGHVIDLLHINSVDVDPSHR